MQKLLNIETALAEAKDRLVAAGKAESLVDAEWLMCEATGLTRTMVQLNGKRLLTHEEQLTFESHMAKRLEGMPIQYILGTQSFYGYDFSVNEHVLIPRFETEELVDRAIKWAKANKAQTFIDMCTGSGCIGLTVLKECVSMEGHLVDYSGFALEMAEVNGQRLGVDDRASYYHSDLFTEMPKMTVDMILSNPPYIQRHVIESLDEEVKSSEPYMALDGGEDGLDFYRVITKEARNYLKPGGLLMFEIGYDQREAVMDILADNGYSNIEGIKDMYGKDRMVLGMR